MEGISVFPALREAEGAITHPSLQLSPAPFKRFSRRVWGRERGGGKRGEAAKIWVATDTGISVPPMNAALRVREEAGHHPHVELRGV